MIWKGWFIMPQIRPLPPTIPITAFNRGQAGKIFSNVKQTGMTVVMKNNEPECVLLSPADYNALVERLEDADLLHLASERLKDFDSKEQAAIPFEEICKRNGINLPSLDFESVEIE